MILLQATETIGLATNVLNVIDESIHDGATKVLIILCILVICVFGYGLYKLFRINMTSNERIINIYQNEQSSWKDALEKVTSVMQANVDALKVRQEEIELSAEVRQGNVKLLNRLEDYFKSQNTSEDKLREQIFSKIVEVHNGTKDKMETDVKRFSVDITKAIDANRKEFTLHKEIYLKILDELRQSIVNLEDEIDRGKDVTRDLIAATEKAKSDILIELNRK